jgi:F0F1-type ATP synthase membrane subunit c/vacuolar-type H+-ATPase subunit K
LLWLLISQLAGLFIALGPLIAIVGVSAFVTMLSGWSAVIIGFACISLALPMGLAFAAWIAFARRNDKAATILSGLSLLVDILLFVLVTAYTNSLNA